MSSAQILVVEDENIVAKDLQARLKRLGYTVPAVASSGEVAIEKAEETRPDLVLMDIMLRGEMMGTEAAEAIRTQLDIPVIYLTAYADDDTLQRAKLTEPFGYILKPFEERELQTNIEIALYKHRMERQLREREEWLATTLRCIGDGVVATDEEGRITFMNPVAETLTGWEREQALGMALPEVVRIVDEGSGEPIENPTLRALREGVAVTLPEGVMLVGRGGEEVPVDDSAAPIKDDKGRTTGVVMVFRDITERKRAEEEKARLKQELLQAQKLEAVGHLTTGVAHNFNNALNVILGNIELATMMPPDKAPGYLEKSRVAVEGAADIVDGLLRFCRKKRMEKETVDICSVIGQVAEICRQSFDRKIEVHTEGLEEPHLVFGDVGQIQQGVLNLCLNARDALESLVEGADRSPCFRLGVEAVQVDTRSPEGAGPRAFVKVSAVDNGIGMDEEVQGHLFEPFFTTKEVGKGTGLGLATTYGIVQEHEGWIECESRPDAGTAFHIYLPVDVQGEVAEEDGEEEETRGGTETILVIDDEMLVRNTEKAILETYGYTVLLGIDGEDGLEVFRRERDRIDLVLLDLSMPKLSGHEVLKELLKEDPDVKVAVLTGYANTDVEALGACGVLTKPFESRRLLKAVRDALDSAVCMR